MRQIIRTSRGGGWRKDRMTVVFLLGLFTLLEVPAVQAMVTVNVSVTVVEPSCSLKPGDETISVPFGEIANQKLYNQTRTPGKPFTLHLENCQSATSVRVTFSGVESAALPGLLAVPNSGMAIGLETPSGTALLLNEASDGMPLNGSDNALTLQAYVQAEPDAIKNQSIALGEFSASATFSLTYD